MNIQILGLQLVTKQTKEEKKELNRTAVQHICTQPTSRTTQMYSTNKWTTMYSTMPPSSQGILH